MKQSVAHEAIDKAQREAVAKRAAQPTPPLPSIEARDPGLREALATVGSTPTAAAHIRVAQAYLKQRVSDAAFDHFSEALRLEPRNAEAWDGRARIWRNWGFLLPALADVHRARYFAPRSAEVQNTLGTILEQRGLCREALTAYQTALVLKPTATWAAENVARLNGCT